MDSTFKTIDENNIEKLIIFEPMVGVIAEKIKKDIVYGRIKRGSKLSTRKISEELNVSRTPVREAIRRLESEGLIALLPRRGFVVKEYDLDEIKEIYQVRKILESEAIRCACINMIIEELDNIENISKELNEELKKQPSNLFKIQEINKRFHFSIYCVCHNKTLCNIIENLWYKSFGLLITIFSAPHRREEIPIEHQAIIAALKTGKPDEAVKALRDHMRETKSILISYAKKVY